MRRSSPVSRVVQSRTQYYFEIRNRRIRHLQLRRVMTWLGHRGRVGLIRNGLQSYSTGLLQQRRGLGMEVSHTKTATRRTNATNGSVWICRSKRHPRIQRSNGGSWIQRSNNTSWIWEIQLHISVSRTKDTLSIQLRSFPLS